jgi:hypothetical protein
MTSLRRSLTRARAMRCAAMALALASLIAVPATLAAQEAAAPPEPAQLERAQLEPAEIQPATRPGGPDILRGSVAPPPPAAEPAAGPDAPLVTAGDRVWFVDQERRRLTGCRLIDTIQVDTQAIRCTERRLPRGAIARD